MITVVTKHSIYKTERIEFYRDFIYFLSDYGSHLLIPKQEISNIHYKHREYMMMSDMDKIIRIERGE